MSHERMPAASFAATTSRRPESEVQGDKRSRHDSQTRPSVHATSRTVRNELGRPRRAEIDSNSPPKAQERSRAGGAHFAPASLKRSRFFDQAALVGKAISSMREFG